LSTTSFCCIRCARFHNFAYVWMGVSTSLLNLMEVGGVVCMMYHHSTYLSRRHILGWPTYMDAMKVVTCIRTVQTKTFVRQCIRGVAQVNAAHHLDQHC
jgi:hypothetical protein